MAAALRPEIQRPDGSPPPSARASSAQPSHAQAPSAQNPSGEAPAAAGPAPDVVPPAPLDPRRPFATMVDAPIPADADAHLLTTSVSKLNRLRAAVLGCNDGITSTAGLVAGVAAASVSSTAVLIAGVSGLAAGALSMGGGEYTSVRAQRDSYDALLARQRHELETTPHEELDELAHLYTEKGLSTPLARRVAAELTARDALAAHADIELGIDLEDLVNPWEAAIASASAFLVGGLLPLAAILLPPQAWRIPVCFAAVLLALAVTGYVAARLGQAPTLRATVRNAAVGFAAMLITYAIGSAVGAIA